MLLLSVSAAGLVDIHHLNAPLLLLGARGLRYATQSLLLGELVAGLTHQSRMLLALEILLHLDTIILHLLGLGSLVGRSR